MNQGKPLFDAGDHSAVSSGTSEDKLDNGLWALARVALHHGVHIDPLLVSQNFAETSNRNYSNDLLRTAAGEGLHARLMDVNTASELDAAPRPAILRFRNRQYSILGERSPDGYGNDIFEFNQSHPVSCTSEEICREGAVEVITIEASTSTTESSQSQPPEFGIRWFLPSIWRQRRNLIYFTVASVFLQLCAMITPLFFQFVIDKVLVQYSFATLVMAIGGLVLAGTLETILQYFRSFTIFRAGNQLDIELGRRLFGHLMKLPMSYFETTPTGQIMARLREVETVRAFLSGQAIASLLDLVFAAVFVGVLFSYSWKLTLIVLVSVVLFVLVAAVARPRLRERSQVVFEKGADNQQFLFESISGMGTMKAAAIERLLKSQWDYRLTDFIQAVFRSSILATISENATLYIGKIGTAAVLFVGVNLVFTGELTVGELIAFTMLAGLATAPIMRLSALWQDFQQVRVSVARIGDIMKTSIDVAPTVPVNLPPMRGAVQFRDVTFRYSENTSEVLRNITLDIPAGQVVGVVGPSGSGKSTLTKLIQRFYLPQQGQLTIDGVDITQLNPTWLRQQIGVVLQENLLFSKTIHENIALAAPHLTREQVVQLARQVGADEFISRLPGGYDSLVKERGANLSGGQRQRLAIARALARNPRILILDEATSAVDYESERTIQNNLRDIANGRTVIIVAHRLAAVRHCDRIVSVVDGQVVEDGTHEELLLLEDGTYQRLWALQSDGHC